MSKNFRIATLKKDGTAVVKGPFSLEPGDPQKPAVVAFYLVQGSNTVGGDGRWSIGEPEWSGKCDGALLTAGEAWGYGMAILVQDEPPGFATWTWQSPLEVTGASST